MITAKELTGEKKMTSEFSLLFSAPKIEDCDEYADRLYEAGYTDVGIDDTGEFEVRCSGVFSNINQEISNAKSAVLLAIPEALFLEAGPDYVGLTDIARIIGVSRQHMRRLWESGKEMGFPTPAINGSKNIWHLAPIIDWLVLNGKVGQELSGTRESAYAAMVENYKKFGKDVRSVSLNPSEPLVTDIEPHIVLTNQITIDMSVVGYVKDLDGKKICIAPRITPLC